VCSFVIDWSYSLLWCYRIKSRSIIRRRYPDDNSCFKNTWYLRFWRFVVFIIYFAFFISKNVV